MAKIYVIGIGLDGADGLTATTQEIVRKATLLIGSDRQLSYFADCTAERLAWSDLTANMETIRQHHHRGENVVVLASGDPLFFGIGRLLLNAFSAEELHFIPHLSSVQIAFSRLKLPWQDAEIVSVHGRTSDELIRILQQGSEKIAILTDFTHTPSAIASLYLALNLPVTYQFWVCEDLGGSSEKINAFNATELQHREFNSLNVVILIRQPQLIKPAEYPLFGLPDSAFKGFRDRPGLITKREVRIAILGELQLHPKQIIWDIGAGTGSVAIEMARLCPTSSVYAIEKTAIGYDLIRDNASRFGLSNLTAIHGKAPAILAEIPDPHRIFIGGSSGHLETILDTCTARLKPDGIVVFAFATIEHLNDCLTGLRSRAWNYTLLQLNISRSIPVGPLTRLSPLNPVTLVSAYR
jgi:precorrin-6Y C5,15-methyltransferase (decarboxylating)